MSKPTAKTGAPSNAPMGNDITFSLTATNQSSVPGSRFFSVFPPELKSVTPKQKQIVTALVSGATTQGSPPQTLTWKGGSGALSLLAFRGTDLASAQTTPVSLGDSVVLSWSQGAFAFARTAGTSKEQVSVTFDSGIPADGYIGLSVGPAPILLSIPKSLSQLSLEPDLSPTATVIFGTRFEFPAPDQSDLSMATSVRFTQGSGSDLLTNSAQINVGPDNVIVQTG
ncbi:MULTISPECIES: hypothetical protein [unclassified Rhizobium]|uniref:hypothetical protein n=1 Tax=unclassified Rhizobium TaxID=2613769 RepID=UPI0007EAC910|nr:MULTISPECIES: hypothetical protein [unclassified Rhizobium]ANK85796.1 hypothetical protein AMK02_CH02214 [Rhizobium sp. N731]ANL16043.1 hypothetical protein AMJ97_CH02213 [Rhizobium sp. N1314]